MRDTAQYLLWETLPTRYWSQMCPVRLSFITTPHPQQLVINHVGGIRYQYESLPTLRWVQTTASQMNVAPWFYTWDWIYPGGAMYRTPGIASEAETRALSAVLITFGAGFCQRHNLSAKHRMQNTQIASLYKTRFAKCPPPTPSLEYHNHKLLRLSFAKYPSSKHRIADTMMSCMRPPPLVYHLSQRPSTPL